MGGQGLLGFDWFYFNWSQDLPAAESFHINEKEILAVVLAAQRWAPYWQNKHVIIYSDTSCVVASLNKGTSQNSVVMNCLCRLFWLSAIYNFHLTFKHIPGIHNIAADSASRLHLSGYLETLLHLQPTHHLFFTCPYLHFLIDRFSIWKGTPRQCKPEPDFSTVSRSSKSDREP